MPNQEGQPNAGGSTGPEGEDVPSVRSLTSTSPFVKLFSTKTRVDITDAMLWNPGLQMSGREIAELAGRHRSGFYRHKDVLKELGILREVEREGEQSYYELDETDAAYHLRKAQEALIMGGTTIAGVEDAVNEDVEETFRIRSPPEPDSDIFAVPLAGVADEVREEIPIGESS